MLASRLGLAAVGGALLGVVALVAPTARAACECGYLDPSTQALWTDAIITYFNETALDDVVTRPSVAPQIYGEGKAGDTGNGTQSWAIVGDRVNDYENSFGATFRSAASYDNTYVDREGEGNKSLGLAMQVSPADAATRVVNGSQIVTRRRDILYGSFRAEVLSATSNQGRGAAWKMGATYNESESIDVGLFTADNSTMSTLRWSFSASAADSKPVKNNLSWYPNQGDFLEHRFDWLGAKRLDFRTSGQNATADELVLVRGRNASNFPTTPTPFSLQAWANGESSQSQGPPLYAPLTTRVRYVRLFFNSSLASRHDEFASSCAALRPFPDSVCSTDDATLRQSTAIPAGALDAYEPVKQGYRLRVWALAAETSFLGIFLILIGHGLVVRKASDRAKRRAAAAEDALTSAPVGGADAKPRLFKLRSTREGGRMLGPYGESLAVAASSTRKSLVPGSGGSSLKAPSGVFDDPDEVWGVPELLDDWDSDNEGEDDALSSDGEGDAEREEELDINDLTGRRAEYAEQLPSDGEEDEDEDGQDGDDDNDDDEDEHGDAGDGTTQRQVGAVAGVRRRRRRRGPVTDAEREGFTAMPGPRISHATIASTIEPRRATSYAPELAPPLPSHSAVWHIDPRRQAPYVAPGFTPAASTTSLTYLNGWEREGQLSSDGLADSQRGGNQGYYSTSASGYAATPYLSRTNSHNGVGGNNVIPDSASQVHLGERSASYNSGEADGDDNGNDAPGGIIVWKARQTNVQGGKDDVGQLAKPDVGEIHIRSARTPTPAPLIRTPPYLRILKRVRAALFIRSSGMTTSTGEARVDYLDGMRGYACLFVSVGHFFLIFWYHVADRNYPAHTSFEDVYRKVLAPITINAGLLLGIFFILPSRTMCARYLMKGGIAGLADNTVRRLPRLVIPVLGASLINYFLIDVNAFKWVQRLNSLTWSPWSYWQPYENVLVFVNAFVSLWWSCPPEQPALVTRYATGVLWTIPLIVRGAWTCIISAMVAHEIKSHVKRYLFYAMCLGLGWYAGSWDLYFMAGLIIADADYKLHYRALAARGVPVLWFLGNRRFRIHGQWFAWLFFAAACVQQWLSWQWEGPGSDFDVKEFGLHPNYLDAKPLSDSDPGFVQYTHPKFGTFFLVIGLLVLADLSKPVQAVFRLRILHFFGQHGMSYFLLHGAVFWTWGAWVTVAMLTAGVPYWAAVTVCFFTSYIILTLGCLVFTATFEYWAVIYSRAFVRALAGGYGRKEKA